MSAPGCGSTDCPASRVTNETFSCSFSKHASNAWHLHATPSVVSSSREVEGLLNSLKREAVLIGDFEGLPRYPGGLRHSDRGLERSVRGSALIAKWS